MIHHTAAFLEILFAALAGCSAVYYIVCLWSALAFLRSVRAAAPCKGTPPVSILKPLKGTDPNMYESFRSHCLQDYPEYEIIFGVSDPADPAVELVERLRAEFPERKIRLIHCPETLGANIKVSNLVQMLPHAQHPTLIVNDSDIRVLTGYLRQVVAPLEDSGVGLVTCLYRGRAAASLGSKLESLGISTDFCAGVLVARQLEGVEFGLGSTLVFGRETLRTIGGFEALVDYLADDYQIGKRIADLGLRVEIPETIVETSLPEYTLSGFFHHQMRWARTVRDSRFGGYLGLGLTFGLPWALLAVIASLGAAWSWIGLAAIAALRFTVALVTGKWVLRDRQTIPALPLVPLRDLVALAVWLASFAGHKVSWRGDLFLLKRGKLTRLAR